MTFKQSLLAGAFVAALFCGVSAAQAADSAVAKIAASLEKRNLSELQALVQTDPTSVDAVVKALLKQTQKDIARDPDFSNKMVALASSYAAKITPPSVPAVCADMRRVVDTLKPEQAGSPLFTAVMQASESFAKAPVVVAAGRPNECEQALLKLNDEALLAQVPSMRGPGLPPSTVRPGLPPTEPTDDDKSSAD